MWRRYCTIGMGRLVEEGSPLMGRTVEGEYAISNEEERKRTS